MDRRGYEDAERGVFAAPTSPDSLRHAYVKAHQSYKGRWPSW